LYLLFEISDLKSQISKGYERQNHSLRKAYLNEVPRDGSAAP